MFHLVLRAAVMASTGPNLAEAAWAWNNEETWLNKFTWINHETALHFLEELDNPRWSGPTYRDLIQKEDRQSWLSKMTCKARDFATSLFQSQAIVPKKIAVVSGVHVSGGKGDLSGGLKIYRFVREKRPFDNVKLVLHRENLQDLQKFAPDMVGQTTFIHEKDPKPITDSDLAIYYPMSFADVDPNKLASLYANEQSSLCFNEYHFNFDAISTVKTHLSTLNKHNKFFYSLGVGEGTVGIMLDVKLFAEYKSEKLSPIKQLKPLATLPPLLQEKLLGEQYSRASAVRFLNHSSLYFGYSATNATKEVFTTIVSQLEHTVNTTVVLLGEPFSTFNPPNPSFLRNMTQAGVQRVELYVSPRNVSSFSFHATSLTPAVAPKTLRIFSFPEGLPYPQALALMKASGREMLVTGDQTISEALSMGKYPLYELLSWKKNFANALVRAARNPTERSIAEGLFRTIRARYSFRDIEGVGVVERGLEAFRTARKHSSEWEGYLEMLHEQHNFFSTLGERIEATIYLSNRERTSAIGMMLETMREFEERL